MALSPVFLSFCREANCFSVIISSFPTSPVSISQDMPSGGLYYINQPRRGFDDLHLGPACITCREKCRKCDRAKPICQRCITKGLKCKGYPDKFRFAGLATRGKWKNHAIPAVSHGHSIPTHQDIGTNSLDPHQKVADDYVRNVWMHGDQNTELTRHILDAPRPRPEGSNVELDDLLMLERTELLLAHCV